MPRHPWQSLALVAVLSAVAPAVLTGQELTASTETVEVPAELAEPIRALLQPQTSVVMRDGNRIEIWWVKAIALESAPQGAPSWSNAPDGALVGAMRLAQPLTDARGFTIKPGVYTLRFALQPQDGNHLGTAEFSYFAVLTPAKLDTKPDGIADYKALVKASSKETSTDHPVILSLRPAGAEAGDAPTLQEPASEHKSIRLKVPAKAGGEKTSLSFEVVYEGKGHK